MIQKLFRKKVDVQSQEKKLNNSNSGKIRKILSKISGAFMLPISVMSIAGLFLGVGAAIAGLDASKPGLVLFGNAIKMLGDPVFAALPLLFAAAFVIAFTDEAGVGVFSTIIAYLVFLSIQSIFIENVLDENKTLVGYTILFKEGGRDPKALTNLVGNTLGIKSLQTSVFGGIAVGLTVQYLYNRFHTIQLPKVISFFGGKRFVSIIAIPVSFVLAIIFLLFWPWIGVGLNYFGTALGKSPAGVESLVFGFIERSLIPFGLHHVFYAPLWYSSAGGDVNLLLTDWIKTQEASGKLFEQGESLKYLVQEVSANINGFQGDSSASLNLLKFGNTIEYKLDGQQYSIPLFTFIEQIGMKIGRFADGKFSFMMFGLPAAAAAMILAAPKENRKVALGTVVPAAFTSFITGVTEPIEFTFLFLAPYLFWGFHATMCAISFMAANLLGVHIPMAFSGGVLDMLLYGIIPFAKGTNFYWTIVVGLGYIPIYFFVFYYAIKKLDIATPGRGGNTKLFTKADFLNKKEGSSQANNIDAQALAIVEGYGGLDNITAFNNCASRLRYDVKDVSKVNEEKLKQAGAVAVKIEGKNHAQAILGPSAEQVNAKIKSQRTLIAQWEQENKNIPVTMEETKKEESTSTTRKSVKIQTAAKGDLLPLESLEDGVFSEKVMGDGFVVRFDSEIIGNVYSPVDGKVNVVFPTKHAYGIETRDGVKVLVHIGIDTVHLQGEGFKSFVEVGQRVSAGDKIAQVDLSLLNEKKIKSDVITVVLKEGSMSTLELDEGKTKAATTSETVGRVRQ
ncbi:PTS transporter subunit IIABC [Mycoplasma leonicaptivi]|uniref:PTS transporter subunit IIABC n=1 Tax=Mycoplasma leonicaptivi TaxID=36742 RepID=UPI000561A44D|nr:PTS transporter subunit IIABC [Mycoplasma leonicaptivi]